MTRNVKISVQATRRSFTRWINSSVLFFMAMAISKSLSPSHLTLNCQKWCHLRKLSFWRERIELRQDPSIWSFSNEQPSDFFVRITTPSLQIRIMSRHIVVPALPGHLHRGRSSSHPNLASRLVRNGITMVRKECSKASPLEVWVDHCSLSICPNIRFKWRLGEKVSYDNRSWGHIRAFPQRSETPWMSEALPCSCLRYLEARHLSWQLPALPHSTDDQPKDIWARTIPQFS